MKDPLFETIKINQLELKNRIYLPAMHMNMARDFEVTDQLIDFYAERARGGVGIITVGYATVDELSGNSTNIGAHKDEFIPGLQRLAQAMVRATAASRWSCSAGKGGHSSKHMMMSAPSRLWISVAISAFRWTRVPSTWLANSTPSSSIRVRALSEKTW